MQPIKDIKIIDFLDWFDCRGFNITRYLHDSNYQEQIDSEYARPFHGEGTSKMLGFMVKEYFRDSIMAKPYLLERYRSTYNCLFLCNNANEDFQFDELLTDSIWHDLNDASGIYLDIYYEPESGADRNGYRYNTELDLGVEQNELPCIVLWKSRKKDRVIICIDGLDKMDVVKVMIKIASMAKKVYPVEAIRETAQSYISSILKDKRLNKVQDREKHTPSIVIGGNAKISGNAIVSAGNVTKIDLKTSYSNVTEAIKQSNLSDEDRVVLSSMLTDIEQLKKKQDKKTTGEKIKGVFKWIADKTVDVGLALTLVPYLTNALL